MTAADEEFGRERISTDISDQYLQPLSTHEMFMVVLSMSFIY